RPDKRSQKRSIRKHDESHWEVTMACFNRGARSLALLASTILGSAALIAPAAAQSRKVGDPPEAKDMRQVGMNDLQARSAYQPTIHKQGDRYIAYVGHHGGTPAVPQPVNPLTG